MASMYVIEASAHWTRVQGIDIDGQGTGTVSITSMKLLIALMFPLMMALFFLMRRRMRH
jgi:hypothetical protein